MFGIGWDEALVLAAAFIILVSPTRWPGLFRKCGNCLGALQSLFRELKKWINY